jgi:outer membrane protein assembly factor BamB
VIKDEILFSTTSSGDVYALDVNDGSVLWSKNIGDKPTVPLIHDNKIYIGTFNGLKIMDINGVILEEKQIGRIVSPPVVSDDKVFVGNENGVLYSFNIESGNEHWSYELPGEIYISQSWNDLLFVCSEKKCYAINTETGAYEWIFETNGLIKSKPYFEDDTVFFGSWDTYFYAVDINSGNLKWKFETGWGVETIPVIYEDLIFLGSNDNNFYALNKNNGTLNWVFTCKSAIHSSPVVNELYVIFGCDDGRLYCLNKDTGVIHWNFSPGDTIDDEINYRTTAIISNPILNDNAVIIGVNGYIYALLI